MATVHTLTTAPKYDASTPGTYREFERFLEAAKSDIFQKHTLTKDPTKADVIIFIFSQFPDLKDIKQNCIYRRHIEKCFVFHMGDRVIPHIPGVYTCIEKSMYSESRTRTGHYMSVFEGDEICYRVAKDQNKFLFSFIGRSSTSKLRELIFRLNHDRGLLIDSSGRCRANETLRKHVSVPFDYKKRYIYSIENSSFVLCPRGIGCSTFRLFETMKAGRVPVIVSDQWVPPIGPKWGEFSIRVRERDILNIPTILERYESVSETMGINARGAWDAWFSREATFHRVTEWCLEIRSRRKIPESIYRYITPLNRLRPSYLWPGLNRRISNLGNIPNDGQ